jgi:hypothetical protein
MSVSPAMSTPPRFDFPTWVPPMLVKELRQGLRQRGFVGGLITVQTLLVILFVSAFISEASGDSWGDTLDGFFWAGLGGILLAAAPLRALGALGTELEAKTMDLLLLTRLDAWRIVTSKWVSLQLQSLLVATSLMPYVVVRYFFGSVDLVQDLSLLVGMALGGAALTAVCLWISGLPRALRVITVIGSIFVLPNLVGLGFAARMFGGSVFSVSSSGAGPLLNWSLAVWSGALATLYALNLAVRWFAPAAENHAFLPRLIPLAMALPVPVLALLGQLDVALAQGGAALLSLVIIGTLELVSIRPPMAAHFRGRFARGAKGLRPWQKLFIPGWPSAALWLALMFAVAGLSLLGLDLLHSSELHAAESLGLLFLGWVALVGPMALASFIPTVGRVAGVLYISIQACLVFLALLASSEDLTRLSPGVMAVTDTLVHLFPAAGLWRVMAQLDPNTLGAQQFVPLAAGGIATVVLVWIRSRSYWRWVAKHSRATET